MKIFHFLTRLIILTLLLSGCSHLQTHKDTLFQTSTINALLEGVYDGEVTFKELKKYGDFGIGTFHALDGEMVGLDGKFYQIKADGIAYPVADSMKTPFAVVTFFEPDKSWKLSKGLNYKQLEECLDGELPSKNLFYAVKIEGVFQYIKTRSVPKQNKPYPRLVEATKNQQVFEFYQVKGVMVGFRTPDFVQGVNVPGYHLHFITEDKKAGGHLLECKLQEVKIEVDYTPNFYMALPESSEFYQRDLTQNKPLELNRIEK